MTELMGIARFKFNEGKLEEFKRLSAQAMEIVRTKDAWNAAVRHLLQRRSVRVRRHRAVQGLRGGHGARSEPRRHLGGGPRDGLRGAR